MTDNFCRHIAVVLVLLSASATVWGQSGSKKVALLVGVNQYQKRGFQDLNYAERDVTELEKELKKLGFQTVLLTGSATDDLRATRENIDTQLLKLLRNTGKQDIVLVALSGHGQQLTVKGPNGTEKDDGFYCPYDAEMGNAASLFSLSYLTDEVLAKKGGRNLVLVDACRDPLKDPGRGARGVQGKIVSVPEDTALFFSCRAGQQSWENDELRHGVFTYCLLEGLRGDAAKGKEIAWTNLVAHVEERMASVEMKKYLPKPQEPIPAGGVGRTVLGLLIPAKPNSAKPSPAPMPSPEAIPLRAPFTAAEAKEGQEAWAKSLGQQVIEKNALGMEFVLIPPGEFSMGSSSTEKYRWPDEMVHRVRLTKPFWLGRTEVTQAQWQTVMGTAPWKRENIKDEGDAAVSNVTWEDAMEFCRKLRQKDGKGYRLPTEAEWEWSCRAGSTATFCFGDDRAALREYAWCTENAYAIGEKFAHLVGRKLPNNFGLSDMHGNVSEWCNDWYDSKFNSSLTGGDTDPIGPRSGDDRVMRGGSFSDSSAYSRCASRSKYDPRLRSAIFGFRVSRVP